MDDLTDQSRPFGGLLGLLKQIAMAYSNLDLRCNHFHQSDITCGPLAHPVRLAERETAPTRSIHKNRTNDLRQGIGLDLPRGHSRCEIRVRGRECPDVVDYQGSAGFNKITGYVVIR